MFNMFNKKSQTPATKKTSQPRKPIDLSALEETHKLLQQTANETASIASSVAAKLESKLLAVESKHQAIMSVLSEAVIITSKYGIIEEWNNGAQVMFGWQPSEIVGKNISIIIPENVMSHHDHDEKMRNYILKNNLYETNVVHHIRQVKAITKSQQEIHIEISINILPQLDSPDFKFIAIIRDVTPQFLERKRIENERRLLKTVINSINDFVLVKNAQGQWILLNDFGRQLYGFADHEYMYKTDQEISELFPEYEESMSACSLSDRSTWSAGKPTRTEESFWAHGERQYFDVIKTPLYNNDGTPKDLVIVGRNVTEINKKNKHKKAAWRALNASSDVICITDENGDIMFCNDKFMEKYGYDSYQDVLGKNMNIIASGKTPKEIYEEMWETITSNNVWKGQLINQTADGKEVYCYTTILPVMNGKPTPIYYICVQRPGRKKPRN